MATLELVFNGTDNTTGARESIKTGLGEIGQSATNAGGSTGGFFSGMLQQAGGFLTANVIGGITNQFSSFVGDIFTKTNEAQAAQAQLQNVLKSTGGAAGVTADAANQLAESLASTTKFSKDAVLGGENMLLTFTNIGQDVFPQATQAMADLSQATGEDMKSASIQLGKALNDPIKGVTALSRVGVSFTDSQKDMIKSMVESGDVAGAQTIILKELHNEFGGSAEAAGQTFAGQMQILGHAFDEVKVKIGTAFLPILSQAMGVIASPAVMGVIEDLGVALADGIGQAGAVVGPVLKTAAGFIGDLAHSFQVGTQYCGGFVGGLSNMLYSLEPINPLFEQVGDAVLWLGDLFPRLGMNFISIAKDFQAGGLGRIFETFEDGSSTVQSLLTILGVGDEKATAFGSAINGVANKILGAKSFFHDFGNTVISLENVFSRLQEIVEVAFDAVVQAISKTGPQVAAQMQKNFGTAVQAAMSVFNGIVAVVQSVLDVVNLFVYQHGEQLVSSFMTTYTKIQTTVATVLGAVANIVGPLLQQIAAFIQAHGQEISDFMMQSWTQIQQIIQTALDIINATVVPVLTVVGNYIRTHGAQIQAVLTAAWTIISTMIRVTLATIQGLLTAALALIHGDWQGAWVAITGVAQTQLDGIKTIISAALGLVQGYFDTAKTKITSAWDDIFGGMSKTVSGAFTNVKTDIQDGINACISLLNDFINGYNSVAGSIPGAPTLKTIDPIKLAKGTDFFQGGLAMVGEEGPELVVMPRGSQVIPNGKTQQMLNSAAQSSGGGQSITINVDARGSSDPRATEQAGYRGAQRALREAGVKADIRLRTT